MYPSVAKPEPKGWAQIPKSPPEAATCPHPIIPAVWLGTLLGAFPLLSVIYVVTQMRHMNTDSVSRCPLGTYRVLSSASSRQKLSWVIQSRVRDGRESMGEECPIGRHARGGGTEATWKKAHHAGIAGLRPEMKSLCPGHS